jgi:hypothetical protein
MQHTVDASCRHEARPTHLGLGGLQLPAQQRVLLLQLLDVLLAAQATARGALAVLDHAQLLARALVRLAA